MEGTLSAIFRGSLVDDTQAYIDFEAGEGERERTRHLYERLLERTSHVKVSNYLP
jgi:hypothetical protein